MIYRTHSFKSEYLGYSKHGVYPLSIRLRHDGPAGWKCAMRTPPTRSMASPSAFKRSEKRWKHASAAEIRSDGSLIDARTLLSSPLVERSRVRRAGTWRGSGPDQPIFAFDGEDAALHGGFFVIPNALDAKQQIRLALACLYVCVCVCVLAFWLCRWLCRADGASTTGSSEYAEEPHVTNMHLQNAQVAGIWRKARGIDAHNPARCPTLSKLRWAAAGYHYEWTERKYFDSDFSPVPPLLEELAAHCAEACGMALKAEAVIVNFYKPSSTMGGHQDDVEVTMDHPVVSVSLGSDCVFLKGGRSKDEPPLEVLLHSGDIAVFGGNSRLSYHGVARVLPTPFAIADREWQELVREEGAANDSANDVEGELAAVCSYLSSQRININIRQVFPSKSSTPETVSLRGECHQ